MSACRAHRPRLRRLLRLPSVRTTAGTAAAGLAAGLAAIPLAWWAPLAGLIAGAAVVAGYLRAQAARVSMEIGMIQALRESGGCHDAGEIPGLIEPVRAEMMSDGVTRVHADSWPDAMRALGYLMGRDRGFQLDLIRRIAQGRLSEVFGRSALAMDLQYRWLGLDRAACRAAAQLEAPEREALADFAAGVNAALAAHGPPFEARFLSSGFSSWTVEHSLVIALYLFHSLSWAEEAKRSDAILGRALPTKAAVFFRHGGAVPDGLGRLRANGDAPADLIAAEQATAGSNCWIRGGADGPVLACDLHLPLTLPNLLYEVDIEVPGYRIRGLATAGLPAVLTGTNGHIAWGVTNLSSDALDLIPVRGDSLRTTTERIRVRGRQDFVLRITYQDGLPVLTTPLLSRPVAARWTGFDPRSCDVKFLRLARARSVSDAITVLDDAQGIPLNVLIADSDGHMAHVATGLLPRRGFRDEDGQSFLTGRERPRVVDPESGILVSANDDALPSPWKIGYDFDVGHRARRVRQQLSSSPDTSLTAMQALQNDTAAHALLPYRDLAIASLTSRDDQLARLLTAWTGDASVDARVVGFLTRFREVLAHHVLGPYLAICREHDPGFRFPLGWADGPLLSIVGSGDQSLLPSGSEDEGWQAFVAGCAAEALAGLGGALATWGTINRIGMGHPFTALADWSNRLTGIPAVAQPGTLHSVRACAPGFGAAGRVVAEPGGHAVFEVPGGQSGHPLSVHYADRHAAWANWSPRTARVPRVERGFTLWPSSTADAPRTVTAKGEG